MRRIYAYIATALLSLSFYAGYRTGMSDSQMDPAELAASQRRFDSLSIEFNIAKAREAVRDAQIRIDSVDIANAMARIAELEKSKPQTRKQYGTAIKNVPNYSLNELDSFLIDMYPRPGVRKFRYDPEGNLLPSDGAADPEASGPSELAGCGVPGCIVGHYYPAHTGVEGKDDGAAGDSLRFVNAGISMAVEGERGIDGDNCEAGQYHVFTAAEIEGPGHQGERIALTGEGEGGSVDYVAGGGQTLQAQPQRVEGWYVYPGGGGSGQGHL